VNARCPTCGGNLLSEHDYDLRRNVTRCMLCGREPREEHSMSETNGATKSTAKWNPSTKTLEEVEAESRPAPKPRMPEMPIGTAANVSADPLSLYMQAARRLLTAAKAHRAAILAEQKAADELKAARYAHEAARAKLDQTLGAIATVEATATAPVGATCNGCGHAKPLKRGRCSECWGEIARKRHVAKAAPAEVPA
jgi:hypothetical protein